MYSPIVYNHTPLVYKSLGCVKLRT